MSMEQNNKSYLDEIIAEVQSEIDEHTATGNIAGYQTPNAFSDNGSKDKKRKKKLATQAGYTLAEGFGADLDIIKKGSKDIADFVRRVLSNKDYKEVRSDKEFHKYLKSFYNESVVTEAKDEVTPQQLSKIQNDIKKINRRIKVYISKHPATKGKLQIELGGDHPFGDGDDREVTKIDKVLKKHTGTVHTGTVFMESVNEGMVSPKRGHEFFQLTKDTPIKYLNESQLKGYLVADVVDDIIKSIGSRFVEKEIKNTTRDGKTYIKLKYEKFGSGVVKILKSRFGIDAKVDYFGGKGTIGATPSVSFWKDAIISEAKVKRPVNRWLELKNDESMHAHKKMAMGLKELKYQLGETQKFFNWYNKIKSMNELDSSDYWKRTNSHIYKIKERLVKIARTIQEIEK